MHNFTEIKSFLKNNTKPLALLIFLLVISASNISIIYFFKNYVVLVDITQMSYCTLLLQCFSTIATIGAIIPAVWMMRNAVVTQRTSLKVAILPYVNIYIEKTNAIMSKYKKDIVICKKTCSTLWEPGEGGYVDILNKYTIMTKKCNELPSNIMDKLITKLVAEFKKEHRRTRSMDLLRYKVDKASCLTLLSMIDEGKIADYLFECKQIKDINNALQSGSISILEATLLELQSVYEHYYVDYIGGSDVMAELGLNDAAKKLANLKWALDWAIYYMHNYEKLMDKVVNGTVDDEDKKHEYDSEKLDGPYVVNNSRRIELLIAAGAYARLAAEDLEVF